MFSGGQSNMMKNAETQRVLNRDQTTNRAHYIQNQKECQQIYVRSDYHTVKVQVPGLTPNFANIGSILGTNAQDIYYQVKSFRAINQFYNIYPSDTITICVRMYFQNTAQIFNTRITDFNDVRQMGTSPSVAFDIRFSDLGIL